MSKHEFQTTQQKTAAASGSPLALQKFESISNRHFLAMFHVPSVFNVENETKVRQAIANTFEGRFSPVARTARIEHTGADANLLSLILSGNRTSKAYDKKATAGMIAVEANVFMDKEDDSIWNLTGTGDSKRLVRAGDDDFAGLLASRKSRYIQTASVNKQLGIETANGDYVVAFSTKYGSLRDGYALNFDGEQHIFDRESQKVLRTRPAQVIASYNNLNQEYNPFKFFSGSLETSAFTKEQANKMLEYMRKLYAGTEYFTRLTSLIGMKSITASADSLFVPVPAAA